MKPNAIVIGSGFSGLSAATHLASQGVKVTVVERNDQPGGRARIWKQDGFTFDMGPSWYWMPDVFDRYFEAFGKSTSDYYELKRLDPSYRVFTADDVLDIPASYDELKALFEAREPGAARQLDKFLDEARTKYDIGMRDLVEKPGHSLFEFTDLRTISSAFKLQIFKSFRKHVYAHFKDEVIRSIMEFPVLFLGATPQKTPALYSLMNYADIQLGTWYPMGGMHRVVHAMHDLAREQGVEFQFNTEVKSIATRKRLTWGIQTHSGSLESDMIIGAADYHHLETLLDNPELKNYTESYWDKRTMAPSSLLFYLGVNRKIDGLEHHNLFFDAPFDPHADAIYQSPRWPDHPLFYVCAPSKTDDSVAPEGMENLFVLIPLAPGLADSQEMRQEYFNRVMARLEERIGTPIRPHITVYRDFAMNDFVNDYHAYKGNAYGLANTLRQTAFLKPALRNKKLDNLWYAGQLTTPGPGVPPALISGKVAAQEALKTLRYGNYN
ncbi:MAG: phytoene desaturase [Flavobacteriales bacterium]|nr:phytoene desaturase [Flavobacteriales bacterium]